MLQQFGLKSTPCLKNTVKDSNGKQYSPSGKVELRWHKKDLPKSYGETFFVVDLTTPLVILGATAFENNTQPVTSGGNVHPVGVQKQTSEEKQILEQKRREAAERRANEKKAQEYVEAERRRQESQKN
ncbi:MAG: hypothetical protein Q9166_001965 [cf. Caloplaca sp. 2 TL-2023]